MIARFALSIVRHARVTLLVVAAVLAVQAVLGAGVSSRLSVGGFDTPGDESARADIAVDRHFRLGAPNLALVVRSTTSVDAAAVAAAGAALTARLAAEPGVGGAASYWSTGSPSLRSTDGRSAVIVARLTGDEDQRKDTLLRIYPRYHGQRDGLQVAFGGRLAAEREVTERSRGDLRRLELLAAPLVLVLLLMVFGSVVASLFSLVIGGVSVVGVTFVLRLVTEFMHVSVYALNIATALSLGLAVDYGLFMVSRFREEIAAGRPLSDAIVGMVRTAGRTVLFSACTVALCMSSLLVIPLYYFRSIAIAAIAVVLSAALSAVVLIPALLSLFGRHLERWNIYRAVARRRVRAGGDAHGAGLWYRFAHVVMRRPIVLTLVSLAGLVVLALPARHVGFSLPDETALPATSETAVVTASLRRDFPALATDAMYVVSPDRSLDPGQTADLAGWLSALPGVRQVDSAAGVFSHGRQLRGPNQLSAAFQSTGASYLNVALDIPVQSPEAVSLTRRVRAHTAADSLLVGGTSAHLLDTETTIRNRLPMVVAILAASTVLLLLLFTGSLVVPLQAVVLNALSLAATFGALVWVFQDGHLRGLIGDFRTNGTLELSTPILLLAIAFGLSMDYEMFVVGRIREEYSKSGDTVAAMATGLQRSGYVITSAALLFVAVMLAFAASALSLVKLVGLGLAFAVLLDVTVVRAVLVPALMRLAGRANWWLPSPLRWLHNRVTRGEFETATVPEPAGGTPNTDGGVHPVPSANPSAGR